MITTQYNLKRGQWARIERIESKIWKNRHKWRKEHNKKLRVVKALFMKNEDKDRRIYEIDRTLSRLDVERDALENRMRGIIR